MANRYSEDYFFERMREYITALPGNATPQETIDFCEERWNIDGSTDVSWSGLYHKRAVRENE